MRILGIDTTTKFLCLGIYDKGKFYSYRLEVGRRLSALLIPTIRRVLQSQALKLQDIDYFACGIGPGSFTGIRIGLAAVKALSFACSRPIAAIPTLDILARGVEPREGLVFPAVDAKRNLIYASVYSRRQGGFRRVSPYLLLKADEFFSKLTPGSAVLGDGLGLYQDEIVSRCPAVEILDKDYWYPQPQNMLLLALKQISQGRLRDAFSLRPIYLYPQDCQVRDAPFSPHQGRG